MVPVLLFLVAAVSNDAQPGPTLPPGASADFHDSVFRVEVALEKGDFVEAGKLVKRLPRTEFGFVFDDSKIPAAKRASFRASAESALETWRDVLKLPNLGRGKSSDLKIGFQPILAVDPATDAPMGSFAFYGESPRLETVIGLKREKPSRDTTESDVYHDVLRAVGNYLGVDQIEAPGAATSTTVLPAGNLPQVSGIEREAALENIKAIRALWEAVGKKTKLKALRPKAFIDPGGFVAEAYQGDKIDLTLQVTNRDGGILSFRAVGDCGCVVTSEPGTVGGFQTTLIKAVVDTKDMVGDVTRNITVVTNDPEKPLRKILINLSVTPRYRFLMPEGNAVTIDEGGSDVEVFLSLTEGIEFKLREVTVQGVVAKATFEPWQGKMADLDLNEGELPRRGYRIKLRVPDDLPPGRSMVALSVRTDSFDTPFLQYSFGVQKGIVANPGELFLGQVGAKPTQASLVLTQPGRPFKVLSVSSDVPYLKPKATAMPNGEVRIEVSYDGKAPAGDLDATLTIKTDSASQPEILIPVVGLVR